MEIWILVCIFGHAIDSLSIFFANLVQSKYELRWEEKIIW